MAERIYPRISPERQAAAAREREAYIAHNNASLEKPKDDAWAAVIAFVNAEHWLPSLRSEPIRVRD